MVSAVPILLLAAAQASSPPAPAAVGEPAEASAAGTAEPCTTPLPEEGDQEIVICVEKPEGYRIDPDIMQADKEMKRRKLKRPERFADRSCASVGPMGCRGEAGINLLAAALTAAEMARRAATGGNVGELFVTDPQPDEYQLYQQARREREAKRAAEAEQAETEAAKAASEPPDGQ
ncbi:MAG TPA: hypothetical protein VFZ35_08145 [Sphingomicrobium sp.]